MKTLIVIWIVILVLAIIGVIVEALAYYGAKKDQEKFDKLSPEEKWKLQQEARKDHLLRWVVEKGCAVVTKDVELRTVVGGNPAKFIKKRKLR